MLQSPPESELLISIMNPHKETVITVLVTVVVAVMATGLVQRLISREKEEKPLASIPVSKFGRELLKEEFTQRPNYANCNSGSFGKVPQRIRNEQNKYAEARELDPDAWFRFPEGERSKYFESVRQLSEFVGADKNNLVLMENASTGLTTALKSIRYFDGDKVLIHSHTYAAVQYTVKQIVQDNPGVEMVSFNLKIPINTAADLIDQYKQAVEENPGIRVLILDHITSSSAILAPVRPVVEWCHQRGILVVVDGAHAPGQLYLNLEEIGADYYIGNLHKWLFAPRGCAFMYVLPRHHDCTVPLVVSHYHFQESLADRFLPSATRDSTPYMVIPKCIEFHKSLGGLEVIQKRNRDLVTAAQGVLAATWGTEVFPVAKDLRAPFMGLVALPEIFQENFTADEVSAKQLMKQLCDKGAFVAITPVNGKLWARLSAHVWNSMEDYHMVRDLVLEMTEEVDAIKQINFDFEH